MEREHSIDIDFPFGDGRKIGGREEGGRMLADGAGRGEDGMAG